MPTPTTSWERFCRSRDDSAGAIDHFSRAVDSKPDFTFAWRELVASLMQSGETQRAKDILLRAVRQPSDSAEFQFHLANLLSREGDRDGALGWYRRGLSIQPNSAELHKSPRRSPQTTRRARSGHRRISEGVWFQPDFVDAHVELGNVLQSQGKLDQAISCYESAATLKPDESSLQIGLGRLLQSKGNLDEAIERFRRAVVLDPANAAAHQFLGNALLDKGAKDRSGCVFRGCGAARSRRARSNT
jgi:tetratricopeptide (TPR) repeat protein